ncbi:unnamed protein product [Debaryomyces tyrocola]|nr:unnamed protein product [Debaryomyces tyrocola]
MNIVYWIFPETKGLDLEEVAQVFGEDVIREYRASDEALEYGTDADLFKSEGFVDHIEDKNKRTLFNLCYASLFF